MPDQNMGLSNRYSARALRLSSTYNKVSRHEDADDS
jgi:hypothetical protein